MRPRRYPTTAALRPARAVDLTPRQRQVLALLVRQYLGAARPVSSQTLAVEGRHAWAPATVRATLNELEELGLLEQPHAAAGRVPTDRGYRVFVDAFETPATLSEDECRAIEKALDASARDVEQLLGQASRLLADAAAQLGFALAPALDEGHLGGLELVHVGGPRILLVLTVQGGRTRTMTLELTGTLARAEIERVARLLRERLLGRPFSEVARRLADDETLVRDGAVAIVAQAMADALLELARPGVFVGGASHVARHPELRDADRLRPLLELLDQSEPWSDLVGTDAPAGLSVAIGREHGRADLAHLSLVRFRLGGPDGASIGLLGPRRMDYGRAMGLVDFVGRRLANLM
jgi:heat-inducible transcriptional repressor